MKNIYDKRNIEKYAIETIAASYDSKYAKYQPPIDCDNFDFVSIDGKNALEVTLVIPANERQAHIYEIERGKGKTKLDPQRIKWAKLKPDGALHSYYGGSMAEIRQAILDSIEHKQEKALRRLKSKNYLSVDLCICVVDGSLFDILSYEMSFPNLDRFVFQNIFFITPSYFIRFSKDKGFLEYPKKLK